MRGFAHPVQYSWGRMCSAAGRGVFRVILAWLGQPFAACPRGVAGDPGFDGLCLFTFACAMQWPWACGCVLSFCFHSGSELVLLPAGFESRMACNRPISHYGVSGCPQVAHYLGNDLIPHAMFRILIPSHSIAHSLGGELTQKVGPNWANTCLQNTSQKATPTDQKSVLPRCPKN